MGKTQQQPTRRKLISEKDRERNYFFFIKIKNNRLPILCVAKSRSAYPVDLKNRVLPHITHSYVESILGVQNQWPLNNSTFLNGFGSWKSLKRGRKSPKPTFLDSKQLRWIESFRPKKRWMRAFSSSIQTFEAEKEFKMDFCYTGCPIVTLFLAWLYCVHFKTTAQTFSTQIFISWFSSV